MADVTQNFSDSTLTKQSLDWRATESWIVTGVTDKDSAIEAAVPYDTPHYINNNMRAGKRWSKYLGPAVWKVFAEYTFYDHGLCATSPVGENEKIIWEPDREMIPVDVDVDGNAIVNSAGQQFNPSPTRAMPIAALKVRRWLPFYSVQTALQFQDKINSNSFTITGAGGVDSFQAYCEYIRPVQEYTLASPYVYVEYRFKFKDDSYATNPWMYRPLDRGTSGWYSDPVSGQTLQGPIVDDSCNAVTFPVAYDGTGKPIKSAVGTPTSITTPGFWILGPNKITRYAPVSNPNIPTGMTVDTLGGSSYGKTLIWKNLRAVDFSALSL